MEVIQDEISLMYWLTWFNLVAPRYSMEFSYLPVVYYPMVRNQYGWLTGWLAGIWPFSPPPLSSSMVIHHVCLNHCSSSSLFYYSHYQEYSAIHVSMQGFAHIWKIMEGWHVTDHLVSHIWLPRCSTSHLGTNIQLRTLIIICIVCMYIRAYRYIPWNIN